MQEKQQWAFKKGRGTLYAASQLACSGPVTGHGGAAQGCQVSESAVGLSHLSLQFPPSFACIITENTATQTYTVRDTLLLAGSNFAQATNNVTTVLAENFTPIVIRTAGAVGARKPRPCAVFERRGTSSLALDALSMQECMEGSPRVDGRAICEARCRCR